MLVALAGLGSVLAESGDARGLLESVAKQWGLVSARLLVEMETRRPDGKLSKNSILVRRDGSGKTRIDFLEPDRDAGKAMLLSGRKAWLYLPRAKRTVAVSGKRNPLSGGFLFDDILADGGAKFSVVLKDSGDVLILELRPRDRRRGQWSRLYLAKDTKLPRKREIFAHSGKLLRTVNVEQTVVWEGRRLPSRLRLIENARASRGGDEVTLVLRKIEKLSERDRELISVEKLEVRAEVRQ
ncbi:MAG: outer membrane lipoprotein-sorting protein [Acidobacteriota bacterium]|nr:outer membrane lipoprotein-sorting protein [Acidobacteriota bacterium]